MKKALWIAALILVTMGLNGCILIHADEDGLCWPGAFQPENTTLSEIDAICRLAAENNNGEIPNATSEKF